LTEQELISGCIREDKRCQQLFFSQFAGKMMTVCRRYARNGVEAEDIFQDSFVKVFNGLRQFEFKGSLEGWVRRIVVNTALKYYEKLSYQKEVIGLDFVPEQIDLPDVYNSLGEEEILKLIAKLPDGYRVVFNLAAIEGYSHKEIAELLKIEESTSRSQLVKARAYLRLQLKGIGV
jgi:RNA polymerase sigma factor (sigma-70 family)